MEIFSYNVIKLYGILSGLIYKRVLLVFADRIIGFPIMIVGYDRKAAKEIREKLDQLLKDQNEQ